MAYFAHIYNGVVNDILVINDSDIKDENGLVSEDIGASLCNELYQGGDWVLASLDGSIKYNAAKIDDIYDWNRKAFITPCPYPSWSLNEDTMKYEAPTPLPDGATTDKWFWDEATLAWKEKYL